MATKKEIESHLKTALKEVGEIKPWFDEEVNAWVFEHKAYPVGYGGESKEEVIKNYPKYLREFIKQRLNDNLAPSVEKSTKGRGGKREGAGRPKGTKKEPKERIYLPLDITNWVNKHPAEAILSIRQLIAKRKH
ncbi:MAG TPA: hypothetical protein VHL30_03515 [Chlamydiales bacterium]|jgi:hypothetical protein|nr:hypothetical protein [Chlamydiales bacterium]